MATKINSGKTPLGGEAVYIKEGVTFIRSQNVNGDKLDLNNSVFISEETNKGMRNSVVQANDILLNITGASLGRSCVVPTNFETGNVNQHVCIIRIDKNNDPRFIQPYFSSTRGQNIFESLQTGSGREGLNFESIKNIKIGSPTISEQRKISSFLTLINERIQTQSKIIEGILSLMGGVLRKLSGASKSKYWEKQFLSDILKERTENNIQGYEVHSVSVSKGVINQIEYLGRSFASKNTSNYGVVHFGDIVYTKSPTGEFPYGIIKQSFINEKVAVSPLYGVFIPVNIALGNILHFYFNNPINTNNYLHSLVQKGAKNTINITNQNFLKKSIYLPTSEKEISSTAGLLIKLKEKIALEQSILDQLVKEKKYLLSNLFI